MAAEREVRRHGDAKRGRSGLTKFIDARPQQIPGQYQQLDDAFSGLFISRAALRMYRLVTCHYGNEYFYLRRMS